MNRLLRLGLLLAPVAVISAWIAGTTKTVGDWSLAGQPAVHALGQGDVGRSLAHETLMGPFAVLVEAPFSALARGGTLSEYHWASLPCLLALGCLGLYLASLAGRRGAPPLTRLLIAVICLLNPLTFEALKSGHPEELLTAALAVGAVATASQGHSRRTAVLLGLAIASKQWAVIGFLPVLMALPGQRFKVGLGAVVIAALLILPRFISSPETFSSSQNSAAHTPRAVTPLSAWYQFANQTTETHEVGSTRLVVHRHLAPQFARAFAHPLIVVLAFVLPLLLVLRRGAIGLTGEDAMALLALLMLLRCALDPVDNLYYHLPFLLALVGWDALSAKGLPIRSIAGMALVLFFWRWGHHLESVTAFSISYTAVAVAVGCLISVSLFRPRWWTRVQRPLRSSRRLSYGSLGS